MEDREEEASQGPLELPAPEGRQQLMARGDIQAHRGNQASQVQMDLQGHWDLRALRVQEEKLV